MQEGPQAAALPAGGQQQIGWRAEDEWMDEYRAAESQSTRDTNAPSARPGLAPEEEALIQVTRYVDSDWVLHVQWRELVSRIS